MTMEKMFIDKELLCQSEEQQSHSPEQHKILEPTQGVVEFSERFTSMEVRSMHIIL